jgi:hypothetical protein
VGEWVSGEKYDLFSLKVYAAQEDAVQPAETLLTEMVTARLAAGQTCVLRVRTGSMTPLLQPGDAVRVASLGGVEPHRGALLVVRQGGHLVTHRLVGWVGAGAGRRLLLQGDACHRPDQPVAPTQLVGVVVARRRQGRWAPVTRWGVLWPLEMSGLWVWLYSVLLRR